MRITGKNRNPCGRARRAAAYAIMALLALLAAGGCGVEDSLDRKAAQVDGIRIDSVRILPLGGRYVLSDSATRLLFRKFHPGYACSEILRLDLDSLPGGEPPALRPESSIRLPPSENCALDSLGRDSIVVHVFRNASGFFRVANSAGRPTDSAQAVRGAMAFDSLHGKFSDLTRTFSGGHFTVIDSGGGVPRQLYAESLASCRYLNHAEFTESGDSLKVRLSIVTLDSSASCGGGIHPDSIPILKAAP